MVLGHLGHDLEGGRCGVVSGDLPRRPTDNVAFGASDPCRASLPGDNRPFDFLEVQTGIPRLLTNRLSAAASENQDDRKKQRSRDGGNDCPLSIDDHWIPLR